jgi:uncharacterized protein YqgQ
MDSSENSNKLLELLNELETLYKTGIVTREEYDCLKFMLNHAYNKEQSKIIKETYKPATKIIYN